MSATFVNNWVCTGVSDLVFTVATSPVAYAYGVQSGNVLCSQSVAFTPDRYIQIWISGNTDPEINQLLPNGEDFHGIVYYDGTNVVFAAESAADCENKQACDCDPVFTIGPPNPPPPPIVFTNTQQCATAHCPVGQPGPDVTYCIDAGQFSSTISQADANAQAYNAALQVAISQLNCGLAGQLNGLLWVMPCTAAGGPSACPCTNPSDVSAVALGNPGQTYNVRLRIRGLVECKNYAFNGVGGVGLGFLFTCTNPTQVVPAAPGDNANEYALVISDPAATYFVNRLQSGTSPVASEVMDYYVDVLIKTGATVTLKARSIDGLEFKNISNLIVNNAPQPILVTEPYNGQFIQMDVASIF